MRKSKSGFTLIELLVVVVIIGILASITIIAYRGIQERARDDRRKTDIASITKALELYYQDNGTYPIPSGTTSTINTSWYSSNDSSWTTFTNLLVPNATKSVPTDPRNNGHPLTTAANYGYAYFSGGYCGAVAGQWYLLVYKYEKAAKEQFTDGNCSTNPLGEAYATSYGDSFYRVVR
jgi:general secretion pathway protein G